MRLPAENDAAVCVQPWSITTSGAGVAGSRSGGAYTKTGRARGPSSCSRRISSPGVCRGSARRAPPPRGPSGSRPSMTARFDAYSSRQSMSSMCVLFQAAIGLSIRCRAPARRDEAAIDAQQGDALRLGQLGGAEDRRLRVARQRGAPARPPVSPGEQPRLREQLLERDVERRRDRVEHRDRRLVQPALDLAEVGVGDLGALGKIAQRQARGDALGADQRAERVEPSLPGAVARHGCIFVADAVGYSPSSTRSRRIGRSRTRTPVAWWTAFATAAAAPTIPISPIPFAPIGLRCGSSSSIHVASMSSMSANTGTWYWAKSWLR